MILKEPTSYADISRNYLKRLFPTITQRVYYANTAGTEHQHVDYYEFEIALMLFNLQNYELHSILYDSFIAKRPLTVKELSVKYNHSKRTIERRRNQALHSFYFFIPTKYRNA